MIFSILQAEKPLLFGKRIELLIFLQSTQLIPYGYWFNVNGLLCKKSYSYELPCVQEWK